MKQETIEGDRLIAEIKRTQDSKDILNGTTFIELCGGSSSKTLGKIRFGNDTSYLDSHPSIALMEKIKEEAIRFLQRSKRHCEELEHRLKEELEDLSE